MQGLGDEFLARAALAQDEHRSAARRDLAHLLEQVLHRRRLAHDRVEPETLVEHLAQVRHLVAQLPVLDQLEHPAPEFVEVDRLGQIVVGADAHRLDRRLDRAEAGDQDHREVEFLGPHPVQEREPVHARHPQVAHRQAHPRLPLDERQRRLRVVEHAHAETGPFERDRHRLARPGLVIDHDDPWGC